MKRILISEEEKKIILTKHGANKSNFLFEQSEEKQQIENFLKVFKENKNCWDIRQILIAYRKEVINGRFFLTKQEKADLDRSIDTPKDEDHCDATNIMNKGGLKCCYKSENDHSDDGKYLLGGMVINYCNQAKDKMENQILDKYKTEPDKVKEQLCWINENFNIDSRITFCPQKTEQPKNQSSDNKDKGTINKGEDKKDLIQYPVDDPDNGWQL